MYTYDSGALIIRCSDHDRLPFNRRGARDYLCSRVITIENTTMVLVDVLYVCPHAHVRTQTQINAHTHTTATTKRLEFGETPLNESQLLFSTQFGK